MKLNQATVNWAAGINGLGVQPGDIVIPYEAIPSKKNQLRPRGARSRGRRYMYDRETLAAIDAVTILATEAWGHRPTIVHPRVEVWFFCANASQDRDGIWTTVVDCLKRASIIHDDSVRWFNGTIVQHPAVVVARHMAGVVVRLTQQEEEPHGERAADRSL